MAINVLDGLNLNSQKITNLADGSTSNDAATYGQLLNLINGKDVKDGVVSASTTNVNISSPGSTLDGYTLSANDRILLKDQTTASQNGIWVWNGATSALTRPADFPSGSTGLVTQGATVVVDGASANQLGSQWTLTTSGSINVDVTSLSFTRTTAAGATYTAGNGLQLSGSQFSVKLPTSSGLVADGTGLYIDSTIVPRKFATNIGDGTSTSITVTHNLGTRDIVVSFQDAATHDMVLTDWTAATTNTVTVNFAVAPASNAYRISIIG